VTVQDDGAAVLRAAAVRAGASDARLLVPATEHARDLGGEQPVRRVRIDRRDLPGNP
jgi:hypothetical protein